MINTIIVDDQDLFIKKLNNQLLEFCPNIKLCGYSRSIEEATKKLNKVDLIFLNTKFLTLKNQDIFFTQHKNQEVICIGNQPEDAYKAYRINAANFLLKPLNVLELLKVINKVQYKISKLKRNSTIVITNKKNLIGVPTMEGMDYFSVNQIIRCEGLQKCTQVITTEKNNIVSAYNIGKFNTLLSPFGFFATHKSHLINLSHVKKYCKEGFIYLSNNQYVPLARRRREAFLQLVPHV